ncbi:DUF1176 domain-containing protein [Undibacterium flavidum]|uniref:DUF1176 domain-containing protein n=1 Tax=Undibacterium flavidum TaxID=2762297 RepID=A0ABR6YGB3_9BURK|nr:DUF1176 domain-containing protein [Undibacterium flavidum]MBC3875616.1 DUF1176 domain-containing protein [Undibacterium flavidum]
MSASLHFFIAVCLFVFVQFASAADSAKGFLFSNKDWEVACDNTRTCRAAGYHFNDDNMAVSVLLTRIAGAKQVVTGQIMLGQYGQEMDELFAKLPQNIRLSMHIDGVKVGSVDIDQKKSLVAKLDEEQLVVLIKALRKKSRIEWKFAHHIWRLSGVGAASVLLKMDEFQGRQGTKDALFRTGNRNEENVLSPLPIPVFESKSPLPMQPEDQYLTKKFENEIRQSLINSLRTSDDCDYLSHKSEYIDEVDEPIHMLYRLSKTQLLVSTLCWRASYNTGKGYWVIEDTFPFRATLVTANGTENSQLQVSAIHKGRGLGDCWSMDGWIWDGKRYVHSESSTTGMCRFMAPGGGWILSTIVSR